MEKEEVIYTNILVKCNNLHIDTKTPSYAHEGKIDKIPTPILAKCKKLHPDARIPSYAHEGDAGMDLYSQEDYILKPLERALVKTGVAMEIPEGYWGNIRDRSGLASKKGIHTLAGVVDSIYRGEIGVVIMNLGKEDFEIKKGDKIAQMLIQKVEQANVIEVNELSETVRGDGGFGSTGN